MPIVSFFWVLWRTFLAKIRHWHLPPCCILMLSFSLFQVDVFCSWISFVLLGVPFLHGISMLFFSTKSGVITYKNLAIFSMANTLELCNISLVEGGNSEIDLDCKELIPTDLCNGRWGWNLADAMKVHFSPRAMGIYHCHRFASVFVEADIWVKSYRIYRSSSSVVGFKTC